MEQTFVKLILSRCTPLVNIYGVLHTESLCSNRVVHGHHTNIQWYLRPFLDKILCDEKEYHAGKVYA